MDCGNFWYSLKDVEERWPEQFFSSGLSQVSGIREKYLARRIELQQFKFLDPSIIQLKSHTIPPSHILLDKNCIIVAQGSILQAMKTYTSSDDFPLVEMPREHNARITCASGMNANDQHLNIAYEVERIVTCRKLWMAMPLEGTRQSRLWTMRSKNSSNVVVRGNGEGEAQTISLGEHFQGRKDNDWHTFE
ncbi:hypothetical protein QJS10_CPB22g00848 [Acorus calamus]|uniref:Uncharacterized protein n=1 Tax=Acorus calamus TaxID=4465 RepID=A0AAV9BZF0_ACOCL|nr:hypothetical protein QJS10_CPB22g00848 [Acorus calamus]